MGPAQGLEESQGQAFSFLQMVTRGIPMAVLHMTLLMGSAEGLKHQQGQASDKAGYSSPLTTTSSSSSRRVVMRWRRRSARILGGSSCISSCRPTSAPMRAVCCRLVPSPDKHAWHQCMVNVCCWDFIGITGANTKEGGAVLRHVHCRWQAEAAPTACSCTEAVRQHQHSATRTAGLPIMEEAGPAG